MAKWIILIVIIFTSGTYIYDPLHRRLIDDEEEERTWCVHKYSSSVQILDWIMNIFHFLVPVSINCISAPMVIIIAARTRSKSHKGRSRSDDPSWRLILCGFATLSALMSSIKQLPAEACPRRNYSENIFSPYSTYIHIRTFFWLPCFFVEILFDGRYNKDICIDIIFY